MPALEIRPVTAACVSIKIVHSVENGYLGRDKESDAESAVNTQGDI